MSSRTCCMHFSSHLQNISRVTLTNMTAPAQLKPWRLLLTAAAMLVAAVSTEDGSFGSHVGQKPQEVPCSFIFGDSLVDNGNNNGLSSLAKADYKPYGIDFPTGPTGRFSNGKTTADVVTDLMGFPDYIPPFATAKGDNIRRGINYASAAGGIQPETGRHLGARTDFGEQVVNYKETVSQLVSLLGDQNSTMTYLSKCIYVIEMGSNDYLNNYFVPEYYSSGRDYTSDQFSDLLIQLYVQQLQTLYDYGARKVAVVGVGPIGCTPSQLARNKGFGSICVEGVNRACQMFNRKLMALVDDLNKNMTDAKFTYINIYGIFQDLFTYHSFYGFKVAREACCGVGRKHGQISCLPHQRPCRNRAEYLFWDAFHPTEAANIVVGRRSYIAQSPTDVHPFDLRHLAQL